MKDELLHDALSVIRDEIVIRDQDIVARYVVDFRHQYQGASRVVLRPSSVDDVRAIVREFGSRGIPLVPQGGNTGYCAGATPDRSGEEVVVSLEKLNKVREIDRGNRSMTVDAGCILSSIQEAASASDLQFPLALGSQQSCQIGGNLSTNAGGVSVLRHGMARDLVLGLEVVLADGTVLNDLNPLRKNNAGYDVKQLFMGSEGTLGIITGVSLRLAPKPRKTVTAFLAISDIMDVTDLLANAQTFSGDAISSFEYISETSLDLLIEGKPGLRRPLETRSNHYLLIEATTSSHVLDLEGAVEAFLAEAMGSDQVVDGAIAASEDQRQRFWHLRESIPEGETMMGGSIKHDVSVRTSKLAQFIVEASALVTTRAPDALLSVYGHVGDGNVHFNIVPPSTVHAQTFKDAIEQEVSPLIYDMAASMEGSFSAEYGIGRTKLALLEKYGDPGKLATMRAVKRALDPEGVFNRGKVVVGPY